MDVLHEYPLVRKVFLNIICLLLLYVAWGCSSSVSQSLAPPLDHNVQKTALLLDLPAVKSVEPWTLPETIGSSSEKGLIITTKNYRIFSTLEDPLILRQIPVFMESALRAYHKVLQQPQPLDQKLVIYIFGHRDQWEDFTRQLAGPHAPLYLKIRAGAYYLNGVCVAYHLDRQSDFSVLAHEGWHQFSDVAFKYQLPAWLDEGLATQFEAYQQVNGKVTFKPSRNGSRLVALRKSMAENHTLSLAEIISSDAGGILSHSNDSLSQQQAHPKVAAYYAQLYALIRFLREDNYGQRYPQLRRILYHGYLGQHWPVTAEQRQAAMQAHQSHRWNGEVGRMLFQNYIAADLRQIEPAYRSFCRKIVSRLQTSIK